MPDVGLRPAAEPLDPQYEVVIKYTIEVEGLASEPRSGFIVIIFEASGVFGQLQEVLNTLLLGKQCGAVQGRPFSLLGLIAASLV
jgi:hypothetical protein